MTWATTDIPTSPGSYVVTLGLREGERVRVGALGWGTLSAGYYLYAGSAFGSGGLRARLSRHLAGGRTLRWHVDYLRRECLPVMAWFQPQSTPLEHEWARLLGRGRTLTMAWPGFGTSDCHCPTHLFYCQQSPSLQTFRRRLARAGLDTGGLSAIVAAK